MPRSSAWPTRPVCWPIPTGRARACAACWRFTASGSEATAMTTVRGTAGGADPPGLLKRMFAAAVEAAQPEKAIAAHLPPRPRGRTVVVGAGKAAASMAAAFEAAWDGPLEELVVTRYGHTASTSR